MHLGPSPAQPQCPPAGHVGHAGGCNSQLCACDRADTAGGLGGEAHSGHHGRASAEAGDPRALRLFRAANLSMTAKGMHMTVESCSVLLPLSVPVGTSVISRLRRRQNGCCGGDEGGQGDRAGSRKGAALIATMTVTV
jgi:hypothetical protein